MVRKQIDVVQGCNPQGSLVTNSDCNCSMVTVAEGSQKGSEPVAGQGLKP